MKEENPEGETRVVFITDMCDNSEDEGGAMKLFELTKDMEKDGIHVSYVGVGVDFDGNLTQTISNVPGCNYFCILDEYDFDRRICASLNSAFLPVCSHVELNVHSRTVDIKRVEGMDEGRLEKDISWTSGTHKHYPKDVRDLVLQMLLVFQRMKYKMPYDVIGQIIGNIHPSVRFMTTEFSIFPSLRTDDGGWTMFQLALKDLKDEEDLFLQVDLRYMDPSTRKLVVKKQELLIPRILPSGFPDQGLRQAYDLVRFVDLVKETLPIAQGQPLRVGKITDEEVKFFQEEMQDLPNLQRELDILQKLKSGQECIIL
jgi:hypothetical protein